MPAVGDLLQKLNPWHKGKFTRPTFHVAPPARRVLRSTKATRPHDHHPASANHDATDDAPPPPPISTGTAMLLIALYALSYFVPFYLSATTRPSPTLSRDAPSVVRGRIRSVTLSCLVCTAVTFVLLTRAWPGVPGSGPDALHLLGLWPPALRDAGRALLLTALLFLGPLFSYFVVERGWADWARLAPLREVCTEWTAWRNIVAGPITEEILFRSASIPLMLLAQAPARRTVFLTPVLFGLAHVHHFYEFRLTHPRVPAARALARSAFQLAYTSLFGAYAAFLFLRTGSLAAVCAAHAFCNCMGLPRVWGRVEPKNGRRPSILWTVAYYVLLVGGAVLWWRNLWVLSESENALVPTSAFSQSPA
ncbi:uncharacterized protein THITE_44263 [Thermothielavioides terrestris NRRL 8126]|uniref:intramembrane prenyl-peptidase Rce1 n=1 Tax=Thermothielavioides terrestris (strain ATCC 38088 / NRRL 8126) TaxID=578455 RepID=G2RBZ2_THETT|nr:uncharacterized protein THITE_44263 [Thermothielavioides terrestris NRRL 8126]AEO69313.1 hypothetical protein THITE_44263 [Thermothielavioides terrestris NRRL 8126]